MGQAYGGRHSIGRHAMEFAYSDKVAALQDKLQTFMDCHVYPNEARHAREIESGDRWQPTALMEQLKAKAKLEGLWNLFLPHLPRGAGLSNLEYAPLCEIMGRSAMASEVFNCSAPDTGNMETLELYGNDDQKKQWLKPLLAGEIRSCFAMTEPAVASSDATNIESTILRDGEHYVIHGRKWWTTGAPDPRCKIILVMGKTDPANPDRYRQQSMVAVPIATPGVKVLRPLSVFGYDDAPHGHAKMLSVVADMALQAQGAAGRSGDFGLAKAYATARALRLVDGPDEVHRNQIGQLELRKYN